MFKIKDSLSYQIAGPNQDHNHDNLYYQKDYVDITYYTKTQVDTSLSGKQNTLVSGTSIKTINNESILGSGNITISGGGASLDYKNYPKYLRSFFHPSTGQQVSGASNSGSNSFLSTNNNAQIPSVNTLNTYGKWGAYPMVALYTNGTALNSQYLIANVTQVFNRNGQIRSIVEINFGYAISGGSLTGTQVMAGISSDNGSGNPMGTATDFSNLGNGYGIGWSTALGHTNLYLIYPPQSGARVFVSLGSDFGIPSSTNICGYKVTYDDLGSIYNVKVRVEKIGTSFVFETTVPIYRDVSSTSQFKPFVQLRSIDAPQKFLGVSDIDIWAIVE